MELNRKVAPPVKDAIDFDYILPEIQEKQLDNGIALYWLNAGVQDVAEIDWVFPAGIWYEAGEGVAQAVSALLKNGTSKLNARQINEALEYYGASLKVNTGNDFSTVSLHCLCKHLPEILPVVFEILTDAVFPEDELEIFKTNSIQRLMVNLKQCEFVANQKIDALIFGMQHPYGRYSKKEILESLNREKLLQHYRLSYVMSRVKIFMAGNVSENEVNLVNNIFGKFQLAKAEEQILHYALPDFKQVKEKIINDAEGVQGAIRIGSNFANRKHPDYSPMVVLNTLFGGYFGSRLMSNIREDKGYTYGIYSAIAPYVNGGSLIIQTEAGRDVLEAAVKEVYHEMDKLRSEPIPEEELLLVKNYLLGNLLGDLDGPFSILQRWRTLIINGFTREYFENNIRIYKTVSAAELQALACKYYLPERFHEVVVV
jgi:predicted Zn-dependent peptidase